MALESNQKELSYFAQELADIGIAIVNKDKLNRQIEIKADGSPVTNIDTAIEAAWRKRIHEKYPEHGILGEEFGSANTSSDWVWVLDPIDGTRQFAAGLANYGMLIALCYKAKPVLGLICQPETKDMYIGISGYGTWFNGVRAQASNVTDLGDCILCCADPDSFDSQTRSAMEQLCASSLWNVYDGGCLGYAALASGRIGVCLNGPNLDSFDICALVPVVEGAGGVITDWFGNTLTLASEGSIVASATKQLHKQVLNELSVSIKN